MKKLIFILAVVFVFINANGQKPDYASLGMEQNGARIPAGLKEGVKAPDFTGYDQTGKQVTLKSLLQKGPVVLFFYRGNWCHMCNEQLTNYQDSLKLITDQGFTLVAITPESIENVENTVKIHNITFTVVYDCQEQIMKDYDVMFNVTKPFQDRILKSFKVDIAKHNGREEAHLPVPATYIINRNGIITATRFEPDFHNRTKVSWILRNMGSAL